MSPIFFVNTSPFNALGADDPRIGFISALDAFDGRHPRAFVPTGVPDEAFSDIPTTTAFLMQHPAVGEYLRRHHGAKLLFLMFDERAERSATELGARVLHPPVVLRRRLDSKVTATRLASRAGVRAVPNVLAHVDGYGTLRRVARDLGPELVVQLPHGDSGSTTFFISTETDYSNHADRIESAPEVKIMRRIRCRAAALEACVTRRGVLVGPLQSELVGFPELTPYRGGWCGNELDGESFSEELRRRARAATVAIGEEMRREGYRGVFGVDYLIDLDDGSLYFGELNPRITGAAPIADLAAREQGFTPLLSHHIDDWLGTERPLDIAVNAHWSKPAAATGWGQLIIDHLDEQRLLVAGPSSGLWRRAEDGSVTFQRQEIAPTSIGERGEALFLRTMENGRAVRKGTPLGRLLTRDRLLVDGRLTPAARNWITAFRTRFSFRD